MKYFNETQLANSLGISLLFARVLIKKGLSNPEEALKFLYPVFADIENTYKQFPDMSKAVNRINQAIENWEPICIYGDYDVDGITSTICLLEALRYLGASPTYHIPHRVKEGYGLTMNNVVKLCKNKKPLLITVDCGITSTKEIAKANKLGSDVIVVDHHQEIVEKPSALAFITPPSSLNTEFAGVGLVFKLIQGLLEKDPNRKKFLFSLLDLVTLGTVIDIAPLTGENRALVSLGLQCLNKTNRVGLQELLKVGNCHPPFNDFHLGFNIGPRLNAAGRMAHANLAVQLFESKTRAEAATYAGELDALNKDRKKITSKFVEYAHTQVNEDDSVIIVVCDKDSEFKGVAGIAGIVASRLAETYEKPSFVLTETEKGLLKGSGRSSDKFSLINALEYSKEYLKNYGGHHVAAGIAVYNKNLKSFKKSFEEYIKTTPQRAPTKKKKFAIEVKLNELTESLLDEIKVLEPFGTKNMRPLWNTKVRLLREPTSIGKKQNHLVLYVTDDTKTYRCIGWRMVKKYLHLLEKNQEIEIAYEVSLNTYYEEHSLELVLKEIII